MSRRSGRNPVWITKYSCCRQHQGNAFEFDVTRNYLQIKCHRQTDSDCQRQQKDGATNSVQRQPRCTACSQYLQR